MQSKTNLPLGLFLLALAAIFGVLMVVLLGLYQLGGWLLILGGLILSGSVSVSDSDGTKKYQLIESDTIRNVLGIIFFFAGIISFIAL